MSESKAGELKEALRLARRRGRQIPRGLREQVLLYAGDCFEQGRTPKWVAATLELNLHTLNAWRRRRPGGGQLVRVQVTETSEASHTQREVTVYGPRGLRVEGLSLDSLAALWERLS